MTPDGVYTQVHAFGGDGGPADPIGIVRAADGLLYGTTHSGGAASGGTLYSMTDDGTITVLQSFGAKVKNGLYPDGEGLARAPDGALWGVCQEGGVASTPGGQTRGTVFRAGLDR